MDGQLEKIGGGSTKNAVALDKDLVRLYIKLAWSPEQIRTIYLGQKIAHILFPDEVPDAKTIDRDPNGQMYIDVHRVSLDAHHIALAEEEGYKQRDTVPLQNRQELPFYHRRYAETTERRHELVTKLQDAGFTNVEMPDRNFTLSEGKIRYLDFEPAWAGKTLNVNPEAMLAAIDKIENKERKSEARALFNEMLNLLPKELKEGN